MIRKQTFAAGMIAALLGLGAMTLIACGGAAKQTNTTSGTGANNSGSGAESQPSTGTGANNSGGGGAESQPSK